jgi:hypothetical protein
VTEKENDDYVPFLNRFFFGTDYDNDFKAVCITFCKLYPSFREPTEFVLVRSFLYMRFVIRWICMRLSSALWAVYAFRFSDMFYTQWHCLAKGIYGINKLWLWLWLDHATPLYPDKLALTSPTSGGRSIGIIRSRTKATELVSYDYDYDCSRIPACAKAQFWGTQSSGESTDSLTRQHKLWMQKRGGISYRLERIILR